MKKVIKSSTFLVVFLFFVDFNYAQNILYHSEIFAPNIISTNEFEFGGTFTPDGNEFYFTRRPKYEGSDNRIFYSKKVNGEWTKAIRAPFSSNVFEFLPLITPDGTKLFFYSERKRPASSKLDGNLWFCIKTDDGWSEPCYFENPINREFCMMVSSSDSCTLYFAGVYNKKRGIFRSEFKNGQYTDPVYLPENINSLRPAHPFIAPDESYLIFDAQVTGMGKPELYISFLKKDGSWTNPQKFGSEINATKTEFAASVTPDGKKVFFHRRENGNGDIYWVDAKIVEKLKNN